MTTLTTLIPAYKADYLMDLFFGLSNQSFKDFRVVLSDDSPDGVISAMLREGFFASVIDSLDLTVLSGPRLGPMKNIQSLLEYWNHSSQLVHIHLDDDISYPEFYREHVMAHEKMSPGASVSMRWVTRSDGRPAAVMPLPTFIESSSLRLVQVGAAELFGSTIAACNNWLGETTNTVFSARGAFHLHGSSINGLSSYGLGDIASVLAVTREVPMVYIRDHLSIFRIHSGQSTGNLKSFAVRSGYLAWVAIAIAAWEDDLITDQEFQQTISVTVDRTLPHYGEDAEMGKFYAIANAYRFDLAEFREEFIDFWTSWIARNPDAAPRPLDALPVRRP